MLRKKALLALLGGVGAAGGAALTQFVIKLFNPRGSYILGVAFSAFNFAIVGICIAFSAILVSRRVRETRYRLIGGIGAGALSAGALSAAGGLGFYLAFLALAVAISVTIHGASSGALSGVFSSLGGLVVGAVASLLWVGLIMVSWHFTLPNSDPLVVWIPFGLISYGFTLGLLLSLPES
jgi:hypothetical protein